MKVLTVQKKEVLDEVRRNGFCEPDITKSDEELITSVPFKFLLETFNSKCNMSVNNLFWGISHIGNMELDITNENLIYEILSKIFIDKEAINNGSHVILELEVPDKLTLVSNFYEYTDALDFYQDYQEDEIKEMSKEEINEQGGNLNNLLEVDQSRDCQAVFPRIEKEWIVNYIDHIEYSGYHELKEAIIDCLVSTRLAIYRFDEVKPHIKPQEYLKILERKLEDINTRLIDNRAIFNKEKISISNPRDYRYYHFKYVYKDEDKDKQKEKIAIVYTNSYAKAEMILLGHSLSENKPITIEYIDASEKIMTGLGNTYTILEEKIIGDDNNEEVL